MATTGSVLPKNYGGGWAIVVGGAGLFVVGGTRFGALAAGLTSVALIFQLVSLVGKTAGSTVAGTQTSTTTGPVGPANPVSASGASVTPAVPTLSQVFNFGS
jgi:hypothetical protein